MTDLKSTYNKIAKDWSNDHAVDTWWIGSTDAFCKLLRPGATVLDIGCGAGYKTKYLTDRGLRACGADFSEEMIKSAKNKFPELDFRVHDIFDIDKFGQKFDAVFAQAVILHVPKKQVRDVLEKMKSILNDGGLIYIAVKKMRDGGLEEEVYKENDYGYEYERFFSFFSEQELRDHFEAIGMEVIWETVTNSGRTDWIQMVGT